jgi:hypothetical protein
MLRYTLIVLMSTMLALVCSINTLAQNASTTPVEVWFGPDNDTADFLDLFRYPQLWNNARSKVSVLKLGPQQVDGRKGAQVNSLSALTNVNAFRVLRSWGIRLAIEAPAIKKWDCTGKKALEYSLRLIDNVENAGGTVDYISMDGPLVNGIRACGDTVETAAIKTADYMKEFALQASKTGVGEIEPYPFNSVNQIQRWVRALAGTGVKPAHFHLDVNVHFVDIHPDIDVRSDLQALKRFFESQNIPFGVIFWSGYNPAPTDEAYYRRSMAWVTKVHAAIGAPDHAIFQSWVFRSSPRCTDTEPECIPPKLTCTPRDPPGCGDKSVPINLPEGSPIVFSHTRLINDAVSVISGPYQNKSSSVP